MPRPKPKFEDVKHYLQGVEYAPFNEDQFIINTLLELHCSEGHAYIRSIGEIKRKNIDPKECPHCKREEKIKEWREDNGIPRNVFDELAEKSNFELVSADNYFIRNEQDVDFRCKECGQVKHFGTPKYLLDMKKINCDSKCQIRVKKNIIEQKNVDFGTNFKNKEMILSENVSYITKQSLEILEENDWHIVKYVNSREKGTFQCKRCGETKISLIQNIVSYCKKNKEKNNGCIECDRRKNIKKVEDKIKRLCEENNIKPLSEKYSGLSNTMEFGCMKCGYVFLYTNKKINGNYGNLNCPNCSKSKRGEQTQVYEFVLNNYKGEVIYEETKVISPLSLDIYLPEKKLAIEYCGTLWHSSKYIEDDKYHQDKMIKCQEQGIRLITIFSDEWKTKRTIVENRIINVLGNSEKIYARKCKVKQIENKQALEFCDQYHIQGKGQCNIAYGLICGEKLVSVMTFSLPMVSKNASGYDYELNRFCSKINVVGGASRLFKTFLKDNPDKVIVSFCDLRWGTGNVYDVLGMEYLETTRPNYYYVGNLTNWERKHRFGFTKKTLKDRYNCNVEGTEEQMAQSLGLYRIYDCGHRKYIWRKEHESISKHDTNGNALLLREI